MQRGHLEMEKEVMRQREVEVVTRSQTLANPEIVLVVTSVH